MEWRGDYGRPARDGVSALPRQGSVFSFAEPLSTPPTSAQADTDRIRSIRRRLAKLTGVVQEAPNHNKYPSAAPIGKDRKLLRIRPKLPTIRGRPV